MFAMETRLNRVKAGLGRPVDEITDRSPRDWYAQSCACARDPASAARIPEPAAASGRRRATGGSGRTSRGAAPARRTPARLGSSTASRPAR